jgi:hypothetical protein
MIGMSRPVAAVRALGQLGSGGAGDKPAVTEGAQAHSTDVTELETHQPDASAANRALELLGRELNLFTEKKEVSKPGDFDHMADVWRSPSLGACATSRSTSTRTTEAEGFEGFASSCARDW